MRCGVRERLIERERGWEGETETDRDRERQTERQRQRETDRQTERQTETETKRERGEAQTDTVHTYMDTHKHAYIQRGGVNRERDLLNEKEAYIQTDRQTN